MKYNDYAIKRLENRLLELFMKKSTPQKYSVVMFEALEVIQQLKKEVAPPPNDPLTMEELRKMDGAPVWLVGANDTEIGMNGYASVEFRYTGHPMVFWFGNEVEMEPPEENYGKTWLVYRRKPEEV